MRISEAKVATMMISRMVKPCFLFIDILYMKFAKTGKF